MRRIAPLAAGLCLALAFGCYTDDVIGPPGGKPANPVVRVHLTDAPFPFDSVQSVNLYVDSIEASTGSDSNTAVWLTLAAPHHAINLLDYQQGAQVFLGQGSLSAGQYRSVRMTIDVDSSSILFVGGAAASVSWGRAGRITIYALVQPAFSVADSVSDLILDFDVGRSFPYDLFGNGAFDFIPWLRAVNSAETGTITGTVTTNYSGTSQPVENADVLVSYSSLPGSTTSLLATGRTDASGHYRVAFLTAGSYALSVSQPSDAFLATVTVNGVNVAAGGTVTEDVVLPAAGAGNAGIHITGPTTVGVGGSIELIAAVTDSQGNPVNNPSITWTSSDTSRALSVGFGSIDSVIGKGAGSAVIRATSGTLSDSLIIQIAGGGSTDTVATVVISPGSANVAVGDSVGFYARPYSASSNELFGRPMAWFISDTTVARLYAFGQSALIQPLKAGTVTLQATSEGKTGTATITVH